MTSKEYRQTEAYRESQRRYRQSARGQAARRDYQRGERHKAQVRELTKALRQKKVRVVGWAKKLSGCQRCGWNKHPAGLDFHHRDPGEKEICVGYLMTKSWERIIAEMRKCDVLCANCHRVEHAEEF